MDNYNLLRNAILNKKQVIAEYENRPREMFPHALGWKDGKQKCLFYQFDGESTTRLIKKGANHKENWTCTFVEKLLIKEIRDGEWFSASNYDLQSKHTLKCVENIDVYV